MKNIKLFMFVFLLQFNVVLSQSNYKPVEGYVSSDSTAIRIAIAVWLPIYGTEIYKKQPFVATLSANKKKWTVTGSLKKPTTINGENIIVKGGVPVIEINVDDGKILRVIHTK